MIGAIYVRITLSYEGISVKRQVIKRHIKHHRHFAANGVRIVCIAEVLFEPQIKFFYQKSR